MQFEFRERVRIVLTRMAHAQSGTTIVVLPNALSSCSSAFAEMAICSSQSLQTLPKFDCL